jgi:2-pyrone-4,6-dicarboxylate lactonase
MAASTNEIPADACDCHVHVIGPQETYPMLANRPYTPPTASVELLRKHLSSLNLSRVVLIQPSFYGTDNRCLLDALASLGPTARGIAVIDAQTSGEDLQQMKRAGVRGVRVNLESIGIQDPDTAARALETLAQRIAPLEWHIQIYASLPVISAVAKQFDSLPVPVVLDHFAMAQADKGANQPELRPVLDAVRKGNTYVKLSAPYRISHEAPDYRNVVPIARAFIDANLERMLWASDWPHTDRAPGRLPTEVSPFRTVDDHAVLQMLPGWAGTPEALRQILVTNPAQLYRF